jgi:hypothetical protein
MPLSEQEQRLLEEMERSLYQNDADFVATVGGRRGKPNYAVVLVGALVAVAGLATLLTGVIIRQPIVGVIGFVIMFVGVLLTVAPPRRADVSSASEPGRAKSKASSRGFMDNLNDRWDKRQDGRD